MNSGDSLLLALRATPLGGIAAGTGVLACIGGLGENRLWLVLKHVSYSRR